MRLGVSDLGVAPGRTGEVRLSEVIGAMSYALDITEGQPLGHAVRATAIAMRVAEALGLPEAERASLFYAVLLKDAGCSTNASKVAALYGTDDAAVKRDRKTLDQHRPAELLAHLWRATPAGLHKARHLSALVRHGGEGSRRLTALRCERGAEIARMIDLDEGTARAIASLDEHWDGAGHPAGLAGDQIPLLARIACLAQTVEVFHALDGVGAALAVARGRAGTWFDPELVRALDAFSGDDAFWAALTFTGDPAAILGRFEPADRVRVADEVRLDRIAEAFARIVDAKSPYTAEHSEGVAALAVGIADQLGYAGSARRDLRRAALLHDVGKLGVSNRVLDKPTGLTPNEWVVVRRHPEHTLRILERVPAFQSLAWVAAAHHERLDGSGYHLGLGADRLPPAARILAVADVCDALSANRPYRLALAPDRVLSIMRGEVGAKLDPEAFAALRSHLERPGRS